MKKKILISDKLAQEGVDLLKETGDFDVVFKTGMPVEELLKEISDANGLIVRSATKVTEEVLAAAKNLQVIARAGVGMDNINIPKCTEKGIVVMNTPGGNTVSTAEQTMALIFALARKTPMADASMKKQLWEKKLFQGTELRRKTIAVIGLGRIGLEVAKRCKGMAMKVIGFDPFLSKETIADFKIEPVDLADIWAQADLVTVHTPLTDETRNLVNKDVIAKMKPTILLINCARGGIYNEQDLYNALKEKRIGGAAIDVFSEEPPRSLPPFHELDNVVLTPHLGASTAEAQVSVAIEAAKNVAEYLQTGIAKNSANYPSMDINEQKFLQPYIELMKKMGAFQGALLGGKVNEVKIYYDGDFMGYNLTPLTSSYIMGLISPFVDININFVNSPVIAKERGIKIHTGEDQSAKDYSHLIKITVEGEGGSNELWGTLIARQPWFVKVDDYLIDIAPSERMLVLHNNDVPNVVGTVGTFLGENGVNIANLHLSRTAKGSKALAIIQIDNDLDRGLLDKFAKLPEILDVKYIKNSR